MTEQDREKIHRGIISLREACREFHGFDNNATKSDSKCICGTPFETTEACGALAFLRDFMLYYDPKDPHHDQMRKELAAAL